MIKNERQYRITKSQVETFRKALSTLDERTSDSGSGDLKLEVQRAALRSQLSDLETEIGEYESLRDQDSQTLELNSFAELPGALIKARIAVGLTQRELAERLHLKEQQIQRYEANGYVGANLTRIQEVVDALGIRLRKQLLMPELPVTFKCLVDRLEQVGLRKDFVEQRLIAPALRASVENGVDSASLESLVFTSAANIAKVFDWDIASIFSSGPLPISQQALSYARFKLPANAQRDVLPAYTVYAHYLALLALQATPHVTPKPIPASWRHVRNQIIDRYGEINLLSVVRYAWDLGIVVLPLRDSGQFHGATWRIKGRNVIVIKQKTSSEARWIIDLLHEIWHAAQNQDNPEHAIIEAAFVYLTSDQLIEEEIATDFAADVVFKGKADELAQEAAQASNGRLEWLKSAVQKTAKTNNVRTDLLANYLAYRLSLEGQNWWGTATTLQEQGPDPWESVRNYAVEQINWALVHGGERELLEQALQGEEV
jgi:transcriptional regulator with XRE-family HTH domain